MFKLADFPGLKATVLGGGKSGQAVAQLLAAHGCEVLISDENSASLAVPSAHITVEEGGHTDNVFLADFIVKSPGIFPVRQARRGRFCKAFTGGRRVWEQKSAARSWRQKSPIPGPPLPPYPSQALPAVFSRP